MMNDIMTRMVNDNMTKFILDTNFITIPGKFKVDIFSELERFGKPELYTLDLVKTELEKLVRAGGKDAVYAKVGLGAIDKKGIKILKAKEDNADDELFRLAGKGYIICTQDAGLMDRLATAGCQTVTMRQKRYLIKV
jgi:rRNA-processing protein FCF1